jgi:hypothetical protein
VNELAGATLTTLNGARRTEWTPSVAFERAFSPKLTVFGEYAPTMVPGLSAAHVIDTGVQSTQGKLQQFDVQDGYLKDMQGSHTLVSVGYSIRRDNFLRGFFGRRNESGTK